MTWTDDKGTGSTWTATEQNAQRDYILGLPFTIGSQNDVNITSPTNLQPLVYDAASGSWINSDNISIGSLTTSGDISAGSFNGYGGNLTGITAAGSLSELGDVNLTALGSGETLNYNGTKWINEDKPTGGGSGTDTALTSFTVNGVLFTGNGRDEWVVPKTMTVTSVIATVSGQPTGASVIIDINKLVLSGSTYGSPTTIFTTQGNRPTIAVSTNKSSTTAPDVTAVAAGDKLQLDLDQCGSTLAGSDLRVVVYGTF